MTRSRGRAPAPAHVPVPPSSYPDADWSHVIETARDKLPYNAQLDYGRVFLNYAKTQGWKDYNTRGAARLSYSAFLVNTILAPFDKDNRDSRSEIYRNLCLVVDQGEEFQNERDSAISSIRKCKAWLAKQHVNLYQLISVIAALNRRETNPSQQIIPPEHFEKVYQLRVWSEKKGYVFPRDALPVGHKNACKSILREFYRYY